MRPAVAANIETDVSLTVSWIIHSLRAADICRIWHSRRPKRPSEAAQHSNFLLSL